MIQLKSIFSDHALFQASSLLTVKGKTDLKSTLTLTISEESGAVAASAKSLPDDNGFFGIDIQTPDASDKTYTVTVASGSQSVSFGDVLFGQLWFASGQSNMEMQNLYMENWSSMKTRLASYGKMFRIYIQDWMGTYSLRGEDAAKAMKTSHWTVYNWNGEFACDPEMPYEPVYDTHGVWVCCTEDGLDRVGDVSAVATSTLAEIYDKLNATGNHVPCGFLNVNVGGTSLEAWIPREYIRANKRLEEILENNGQSNDISKWNNHILQSYNQNATLFNLKTFPCLGVRTAGILWYQGENNNGTDPTYEFYYNGILQYYKAHRDLFAASENFPVLCAQIFPFLYSENRVGIPHVSYALADIAADYPGTIVAVPTVDQKATWIHCRNHPIHPGHKYELGKTFALLALRNRYGFDGVKSAPVPSEYIFENGKATVVFDLKTGSLRLTGRYGFRIAGENNKYYDAFPEVSGNKLILSHPAVSNPVKCSFGYSDLDLYPSLFADDVAVSCFASDITGVPQTNNKSWLFPEIESYSIMSLTEGSPDFYKRPTWRPGNEDTELCRDNAFTHGTCSIRLRSETGKVSAFVSAYLNARLDLQKFSGLTFELIANRGFKSNVTLKCENHDDILLPIRPVEKLAEDRTLMQVDFDVPADFTDETIKRMYFTFENEDTFPLCTLAMENFILH